MSKIVCGLVVAAMAACCSTLNAQCCDEGGYYAYDTPLVADISYAPVSFESEVIYEEPVVYTSFVDDTFVESFEYPVEEFETVWYEDSQPMFFEAPVIWEAPLYDACGC